MTAATLIVVLSACAQMEHLSPTAVATLRPASGTQVAGVIRFYQVADSRVRIVGDVNGHLPGRRGFHIHEMGDCSAHDAMSAGGHYNPTKRPHGSQPSTGHVGDLANLTFDAAGRATIDLTVDGLSTTKGAPNSILGRALMVHMQEDDLTTDPTGNAGARAACGVIS